MESVVSIRRCADYDARLLRPALEQIIEDLGGPKLFFKWGEKVLLKPNLLKAAPPDKAVVTHPSFVEAVASMAIDAGATPFLGDSPSIGSLSKVLSRSGYDPFMKRLGIRAVPFGEKESVEIPRDRPFRKLDLAHEVFQFDAVINLPKLKTHNQMMLTLAVKNLFGTVVGPDKVWWHLRAGKDYDSFATVLIQILEQVKPVVSIIDGILGMEGDGPNSGIPRHIGLIGASTDAVALDASLCRLLGLRVEAFRTCAVGELLGVGHVSEDRIRVMGHELPGFPLKDFKLPQAMTMTWNLSPTNPVRRFMENHVITRPSIDSSACSQCKICADHCPPGAISEKDGKIVIDNAKCISCFCCHELCSSDAIRIVRPRLGRLLSFVTEKLQASKN